MPFITYTKVKSREEKRASTPPSNRSYSTVDALLMSCINHVPPEKGVIRSYSPVPRSKPLGDNDELEAYEARILELGNDMDDCLDFLKDLNYFVKESEDLKVFDGI